ncbi:MAG: hypothetical protein AUK03_10490 [Anaerolineae bacterium CG2_30_64_16]|nr:MAG: hypothetical protein AUK03_10490 [Anaerolineae bacterium CG2_30_64_16]
MKGFLAGLLIAMLVLGIALVAATAGALGIAAVGWLLHHWFDLSQWQGSVIALAITFGLGWIIYKGLIQPTTPWSGFDLDDDDDDDDDWEDYEEEEPPIVPWRRSRPTPGNLPNETPAQKPSSGAKKRK